MCTIPAEDPEGLSSIELAFTDVPARPQALTGVAISQGARPLTVGNPTPAGNGSLRIQLASQRDALTFEYRIDPTFYPPGGEVTQPSDARSRLTSDLGVLRTSSFLPRISLAGLRAHVIFMLPDGWSIATPWAGDGAATGFLLSPQDLASTEYLLLGPIALQDLQLDNGVVRIAVPPHAKIGPEAVATILRTEIDIAGGAPPGWAGAHLVGVVPGDFMRGGASGARSTIQPPLPDMVAHEVFHWWNNGARIADEANWFREGFTEYYGVKVAEQAGVMTGEQAQACFADLNGELRYLDTKDPRSLIGVSKAGEDPYARRLVYSKGALFALYLDTQILPPVHSLDDLMSAVIAQGARPLGNQDLRKLFQDRLGQQAAAAFDAYVTQPGILPDQNLGPATGRSGCARYLPGR